MLHFYVIGVIAVNASTGKISLVSFLDPIMISGNGFDRKEVHCLNGIVYSNPSRMSKI